MITGQSDVVFIKGSSVTHLVSARTKQTVLFPVNISTTIHQEGTLDSIWMINKILILQKAC